MHEEDRPVNPNQTTERVLRFREEASREDERAMRFRATADEHTARAQVAERRAYVLRQFASRLETHG